MTVTDTYAAYSTATTTCQVTEHKFSMKQLAQVSSNETLVALQTSNYNTAKQMLQYTSAAIKTSLALEAKAGGRRLLTIDESAASVNENSLVSLWQTYAMTPVTTGDMSSIITTAAGGVATPTHVTAPTALGTLELVNDVNRAPFLLSPSQAPCPLRATNRFQMQCLICPDESSHTALLVRLLVRCS